MLKDLNIFFGDCGVGKSSLMIHCADEYVREQGDERLELCRKLVEEENARRKKKLTLPTSPPIYSNLNFILNAVDGAEIKPKLVSGRDIGLNSPARDDEKYINLYPASLLIIDEAHNEFSSKGGELPKGQRDFFNRRRHNRQLIMLATPRAILINKDIRGSGAHFIEVREQIHTYSPFGFLERTEWHCREFDVKSTLEEYLKSDGSSGGYDETEYIHEGDVYELYDSYAFAGEFMPEEGSDYE